MSKTIEELEGVIAELKAKIAGLAKRGQEVEDLADDEPVGRNGIPRDRWTQHREQLRQLRAETKTLSDTLEKVTGDLKVATDTAVKAAKEEAGKSVSALQAQHNEDLGLAELGIKDPTGRRLIREHVAALPEAERKAGSPAWLKGHLAAAKARQEDPEKPDPPALPWLTGYLQAPEQKSEEKPPPNIDANTGRRTGVSADSIKGMAEKDFLAMLGQ